MLNNRNNILAGISACMAMGLLLIAKGLIIGGVFEAGWQAMSIIQVLAFLIPTIFLCVVSATQKTSVVIPVRAFGLRAFWLTVTSGAACSMLAFWANFAVINSTTSGESITVATNPLSGSGVWVVLLVGLVIPAIFEELLFRGTIQTALKDMGSGVAILVSAMCFSIIHSDFNNIAGSLLVGLLCGYLTYSFTSVFPAMIVHFICNGCSLLMNLFVDTYKVLGLTPYFLMLTVFLFLIFTYISLGNLEKLMLKGKIERFKKGSFSNLISATLGSPGVVALFLITIMIMAYKS